MRSRVQGDFAAPQQNGPSAGACQLHRACSSSPAHFGEMARLDLHSQISISKQASALAALPADLKLSADPNRTGRLAPAHSQSGCVDETNPEWAGNDEIGLGGVGLDETGEV